MGDLQMVPTAPAAESDGEYSLRVFVKFLSKREIVVVQSTDTIKDLVDKVASITGHRSFMLAYEGLGLTETDYDKRCGDVFPSSGRPEVSVEELDYSQDENYNNNNNNNYDVKNNSEEGNIHHTASWNSKTGATTGTTTTTTTSTSTSTSTNNNNYSSSSSYSFRATSRFRGLSNQGATCYMNSLLQSLFMTPEFRAGLYRWPIPDELLTDVTKRGDSIPLQLAKLFAGLQLNQKRALETKDLTKSFGWGSSDAFTQHDVQELCRVLFDSLENAFDKTPLEKLIQDLYQGEMLDYVQCKECLHSSSRVDKFLDIPVTIRSFGSTTAIGSVEEALKNFVQPEVLDGQNQYHCENCKKKTDALKGLKLTKLPYVLTVLLKRFDIDYATMRRIKLNDRVTFPKFLDMAPYVSQLDSPSRQASSTPANGPADEESLPSVTHADSDLTQDSSNNSSSESSNNNNNNNNDENNNDNNNGEAMKIESEHVYELYSIMIHSGSAFGGHYYAYIKSLDDGKWFKFNDSMVSELDEKDIEETFGGSSYGFYNYQSSANAYMLLYRRVDPQVNLNVIPDEAVPAVLQNLMEEDARIEEQKVQEHAKQSDSIKITIFHKAKSFVASFSRQDPLSAIVTQAVTHYKLENIPQDRIRLRRFYYSQSKREIILATDTAAISSLFQYSEGEVGVEIRSESEEFAPYVSGETTFKFTYLSSPTSAMTQPRDVSLTYAISGADARRLLAQRVNMNLDGCTFFKFTAAASQYSPSSLEIIRTEATDRIYISESSLLIAVDNLPSPPPSPLADSDLGKKIKEEATRVKISFSALDGEECEYEMEGRLEMTVNELKQAIGNKLNLPPSKFRLFRSPRRAEMNQLFSSLTSSNVPPFSPLEIFVETPTPSLLDAKFYLVKPELFSGRAEEEKKAMEEWCEMKMDESETVGEWKQTLSDKLRESGKLDIPPPRLRLREIDHYQCLTKVYSNETQLKPSYNKQALKIGIQVLPEDCEEEPKKKDMACVSVQQVLPESYELGKRFELCLPEKTTNAEFFKIVSEKTSIPESEMEYVRSVSSSGTPLVDIFALKFSSVTQAITSQTSYYNEIVYLFSYSDSGVVYIRDKRSTPKELTPEEKEKFEKEAKQMRAASSASSSYSYKEKKLTIKGGGPKVSSASTASSASSQSNATTPNSEDQSGGASC